MLLSVFSSLHWLLTALCDITTTSVSASGYKGVCCGLPGHLLSAIPRTSLSRLSAGWGRNSYAHFLPYCTLTVAVLGASFTPRLSENAAVCSINLVVSLHLKGSPIPHPFLSSTIAFFHVKPDGELGTDNGGDLKEVLANPSWHLTEFLPKTMNRGSPFSLGHDL